MAAVLSPEQIQSLASAGPRGQQLLRRYHSSLQSPLERFTPRPDNVAEYDQQTGFMASKAKFSILLGGTGSGKTECAAAKTARYLLENKPPRQRTPFWVVGDTFETVCAICWDEKLSKYIQPNMIKSIDWHKRERNWPFAVTLKHPDNPNKAGWVIEFKSYAQGLGTIKGRSVGGYWLNEECPLPIVKEVQGRCRDYGSPGWADFTPIEVVSPEWPDLYDNPPDGWEFFHLNVEKNEHIDIEWRDSYWKSFPEDEQETRRIGTFASYLGMVFKEWRKPIHVIEPFPIPASWRKNRGIDFGFNNPFCCTWNAKDPDGRYYIYREHYAAQQLNSYHAEKINEHFWDYKDPHCGTTFSDHDAQQIAELISLGVRCVPASKSNKLMSISQLRKLMKVQADGKPKFFVFDTCINTILEIRGYRWRDGTDTKSPKELPVDKDDHAVDSVLYGVISDLSGEAKTPRGAKREWQPAKGIQLARR